MIGQHLQDTVGSIPERRTPPTTGKKLLYVYYVLMSQGKMGKNTKKRKNRKIKKMIEKNDEKNEKGRGKKSETFGKGVGTCFNHKNDKRKV